MCQKCWFIALIKFLKENVAVATVYITHGLSKVLAIKNVIPERKLANHIFQEKQGNLLTR